MGTNRKVSMMEAIKIENVEPVQSVKFVRFQKEHLHLNNVFQYAVDKNNPLMIFEVCRFINGQSKKSSVKRRFKFYEKYFCLHKYDYLIKDELKKINSWILFLQSEI